MTWLQFIALILATGAIIDVWKNGEIFAGRRAAIEARQAAADPEARQQLLWELLTCPYCQSYHVPFWLTTGLGVLWYFNLDLLGWGAVFMLAVTRASNLLEQALPHRMRYARREPDPDRPGSADL